MTSQCWIGKNFLSGISYWPGMQINGTAVVLVSGFSQPMCDLDYFMSKLARYLAGVGFYVLQVDPRGHGDSPGTLDEITLSTMREDIEDTVAYLRKQWEGNILFIGRGLIATLAAELADKLCLSGIAGVSPYCLNPEDVSLLWKNIKSGIYELADIYPGRYYTNCVDFDPVKAGFFCALGACPSNLQGQQISSNFLIEISNYDPYTILNSCKTDSLWLFGYNTQKDDIFEWHPSSENRYISFSHYIKGYIPRNPMWQRNAIEKLCTWAADR